jgi:hypothetical protein
MPKEGDHEWCVHKDFGNGDHGLFEGTIHFQSHDLPFKQYSN